MHPLRGLSLAKSVDYFSLRAASSFTGLPPGRVVDETGSVCATATDHASCIALVGKYSTASGWQNDEGFENAVATVKDDVISYQSAADLLRLLGPIDTPEEAVLFARATSRKLACDVDPAVTQLASGAYFMTMRGLGCVEDVTVTRDGVLTAENGRMEFDPEIPCSTPDAGPGVGPVTDTFFDVDTGSVDTGMDSSVADSVTDADG
ncbi:MAG: hypothetical protein ACXVEF_40100 [Polyangiales bacterium]